MRSLLILCVAICAISCARPVCSGSSYFSRIAPAHLAISYFSEGLAPFYEDGDWGYLDVSGKVVISARFSMAFPFSEGVAVIVERGRYGVIDRMGNYVLAPEWDRVVGNSASSSLICVGRKIAISDDGFNYEWRLFDVEGKLQEADLMDAVFFVRGKSEYNRDGLVGFVRRDFSWCLDPIFVGLGNRSPLGITPYSNGNLWGLIDNAGLVVCEPRFLFIGSYDLCTNLAPAAVRSGADVMYGYIDSKGEFRIKPIYRQAFGFSEGVAVVQGHDGMFSILDSNGVAIPLPDYRQMDSFFSENRCAVYRGNKWGYIDRTGALVISPTYRECGPFRNGYAAVSVTGYEIVYIDENGVRAIEPK